MRSTTVLMQWTNFLRDIDEDWRERGRVYLPQDHVAAQGLASADITARTFSLAFKVLIKEEIVRADTLYADAEQGIKYLSEDGRLGVLVASRLYQVILRAIERQGPSSFAGRARTAFPHKLSLSLRAYRDLGQLIYV